MREQIEAFLQTADSPETRNITELKALYEQISGKKANCESPVCISKMLTIVRKYYHAEFKSKDIPEVKRKYTLKPGNHTFAPGGPAVHNNDNTSDEAIESHLKNYPHIKTLLQ